MTTAFLRSPADSLAGMDAASKLRRRKRGLLLQEDGDQDIGPYSGAAKRRTGGQGSGPNMTQNRDIQAGSGSARPQDTKVGAVGRPIGLHEGHRVAQFAGKSGSVGQEANDRDTVGGRALDKSGQDVARDMGGSTSPQGEKPLTPMSDGEVQSAIHKFVWDAIEYV